MEVKDLMLADLEDYQEKYNSNRRTSCYTYFRIVGNFAPDTISELIGLSPEKIMENRR